MVRLTTVLLLLMIHTLTVDAAIQWFSQQPATTTLNSTDVFAIESPHQTGYKYISYLYLANAISNTLYANNFSAVWTNDTSKIVPLSVEPVILHSIYTSGDPSHIYFKAYVDSDGTPLGQANAVLDAQYFNATGNSQATLTLYGRSTAGQYGTVTMLSGGSGSTAGVASFTMMTNSTQIFNVNTDGLVSGKGYKDSSLTEGYLVGVGPSGRLVQTNVDQVITNNYFQLISGNKVTVNNIYTLDITATNGFYIYTNTWANSPTGTVDLRIEDQYVQTYTPLSITGFTSKSNRVVETVVMTITNASTTNIGVFLADGIKLDTRTNSCTVSNGSFGILTIRYHPTGLTNAIYKQW